ncbi:MAG: rhomboid family intramembrane serine protease [Pseudomonadales bacterium]
MRVIQTSLDEDLSVFSRYLWQRRVVHRVFEERGAQVLEVADPAEAAAVRDAFDAWKSGRLQLEQRRPAEPRNSGGWSRAIARYPALSTLIALSVLAFPFSWPLSEGRLTELAAWLTIIDPRLPVAALPSLPELLARLEIWRWFTPMLLHFSVLHLGFNCAITVELGRRAERGLGSGGFVLLVLAMAAVSNLIQYAFGGNPLFGGLSGVAYGLLGFVLTMNRLAPAVPEWQLPKGLAIGLLIFLVIFTTGITEAFGLFIANAAHWGGLASGVLLALAHRAWGRAHA